MGSGAAKARASMPSSDAALASKPGCGDRTLDQAEVDRGQRELRGIFYSITAVQFHTKILQGQSRSVRIWHNG